MRFPRVLIRSLNESLASRAALPSPHLRPRCEHVTRGRPLSTPYLERLYAISEGASISALARNLLLDLNTWTDMLPGNIRRILIRGSDLNVPSTANLRLCYLAPKFYNCVCIVIDNHVPSAPSCAGGVSCFRITHIESFALSHTRSNRLFTLA